MANGWSTSVLVGSEASLYHSPDRIGSGTRYGVLLHHGYGDSAGVLDTTKVLHALTDNLKLPVLSSLWGSASSWANTADQSALDSGFTAITGQAKVNTSKVILVGVSMGFPCIARWARANPTKVLAMVGIVPACDTDDIYNNDRPVPTGGLKAGMDAAWSGNYLTNGSSLVNPSKSTNPAGLTSIPGLLIYSSGDTIVIPSTVTGLVTAIGGSNWTAVHPSDDGDPHNYVPSLMDPAPVLSFLAGLI